MCHMGTWAMTSPHLYATDRKTVSSDLVQGKDSFHVLLSLEEICVSESVAWPSTGAVGESSFNGNDWNKELRLVSVQFKFLPLPRR